MAKKDVGLFKGDHSVMVAVSCTNCRVLDHVISPKTSQRNFINLLKMRFCLTCWRKIVKHFAKALV